MAWLPRYPRILLFVMCTVFLTTIEESKKAEPAIIYVTPISEYHYTTTPRSRAAVPSSKPIGAETSPAAYKDVSINPSERKKLRKVRRRKKPKSMMRLRKDQKKYKYEMPLRGFRRPKVRQKPNDIVKMMAMPAMRWLYRWFFDVYTNQHEFTDIVYVTGTHAGKAYVTVCPHQHRLRFEVESETEFTMYLMPAALANGGAEVYDNHLQYKETPIPTYSIRISVKEKETRLVVFNGITWNISINADLSDYNANSDAQVDFAIFQHVSISNTKYHSYWLWWEQNGFIYMGRDNDPPYLAHLVNYPDLGHQGAVNNIRTIAFGVSHMDSSNQHTVRFLLHLEHPHGDKDCPDIKDDEFKDSSEIPQDMIGWTSTPTPAQD